MKDNIHKLIFPKQAALSYVNSSIKVFPHFQIFYINIIYLIICVTNDSLLYVKKHNFSYLIIWIVAIVFQLGTLFILRKPNDKSKLQPFLAFLQSIMPLIIFICFSLNYIAFGVSNTEFRLKGYFCSIISLVGVVALNTENTIKNNILMVSNFFVYMTIVLVDQIRNCKLPSQNYSDVSSSAYLDFIHYSILLFFSFTRTTAKRLQAAEEDKKHEADSIVNFNKALLNDYLGIPIFAYDGKSVIYENNCFKNLGIDLEMLISYENRPFMSIVKEMLKTTKSDDTAREFDITTNLLNNETPRSKEKNYFSFRSRKTNSFTFGENPDSILLGVFLAKEYHKIKAYYDIKARVLETPSKNKILFFLLYDLSSVRETEQRIIEKKLKQNLFNKFSHEFKTPLLVISTLLEKVHNRIIDKEYIKAIKFIKDGLSMSQYTVMLIEDTIHYSQDIEKMKNEIKPCKELINVMELIDYIFNIMKSLLEHGTFQRKNVKPVKEIDPAINKYVVCSDMFRLKQILINFITNSVKFTKNGAITVEAKPIYYSEEDDTKFDIHRSKKSLLNKDISESVQNDQEFSSEIVSDHQNQMLESQSKKTATAHNDEYNSIIISIKDTGIGIEKDRLVHLKSRMSSLKLEADENYNEKLGTGVGLSIASIISSILGVKLSFDSYLNSGSIFSIIIPCEKDESIVLPEVDNVSDNKTLLMNSDLNNDRTIFELLSGKLNFSTDDNSSKIILGKKHLNTERNSSSKERRVSINFPVEKAIKSPPNKRESRVRKSLMDYDPKCNLFDKVSKSIPRRPRNSVVVNTIISQKILDLKKIQSYLDEHENEISSMDPNTLGKFLTIGENTMSKTLTKFTNKLASQLSKTILICDDSFPIRQSLKLLLSQLPGLTSQYNIVECRDGIETLKCVVDDQSEGNKIKVVLTDENMEYMNGSESVRVLKRLESQNKIQKCFYFTITAYDDEETRRAISNAGVEEVLSKPLTKSVISKLFSTYGLI